MVYLNPFFIKIHNSKIYSNHKFSQLFLEIALSSMNHFQVTKYLEARGVKFDSKMGQSKIGRIGIFYILEGEKEPIFGISY